MYRQNLSQLERTERRRKYVKIVVVGGALAALVGLVAPESVKTRINDGVKSSIEYLLPQSDDRATVCRHENGTFYAEFRGERFGIAKAFPSIREGGGVHEQLHNVNYERHKDQNPIIGDSIVRKADLYNILNQNEHALSNLEYGKCVILGNLKRERVNPIAGKQNYVPYDIEPRAK